MSQYQISKLIKKYKKKFIVIFVLIILVIFIVLIYNIIENLKVPTSLEDFKSVKQVIEYLGSTYISEESLSPKIIRLKFKYKLYNNDNTSNEVYFNKMINGIAEVLKYKNFNLVDEENSIYIDVECEEDKVASVIINGSENYFSTVSSKKALESYTKINNINVNINSSILNSAIKSDWNYSDSLFGSKDSYYNEYNIFFDEGIEVKNVSLGADVNAQKLIFNIVFNSKYKSKIVNNLDTSSSLEDVVNVLGTPHFGSVDDGIIGYKTDKFYIFFNLKNEVSIYRIQIQENNDFAKLVGTFVTNKDASTLLEELPVIWPFVDRYRENSKVDSKELVYTLLGVKVQFNVSNEQGVVIYNNFSGNITESLSFSDVISGTKKLPDNVYFENTDLVYENEKERTFYSIDTQFMKQSEDYIIYSTLFSDGYYNLKFISKNENYPNSELLNTVSTFEFIENTKIIYSIKNEGMYMYDIVSQQKSTIIEGKDNFNINKVKDGIVYYDNTNLKIK